MCVWVWLGARGVARGVLHCTACGILVPQPGIEIVSPALEVWSLNPWTAKKVPKALLSYLLTFIMDLRLLSEWF